VRCKLDGMTHSEIEDDRRCLRTWLFFPLSFFVVPTSVAALALLDFPLKYTTRLNAPVPTKFFLHYHLL
jgi:hypothetical protein